MTDEDLNKIKLVIREEVKEVVKSELESALKPIKQTLSQNTDSLIIIKNKINTYGDMYKINGDNIRRVDSRLSEVEENLGMEPDPDLLIKSFPQET